MTRSLLWMVAACAQVMLAQQVPQAYIDALRSDLRADKEKIITAAMQMDEPASKQFWPIYREYQTESSKLTDERIQLIKDYASQWQSLTNEQADALAKRALKLQGDRHKLLEKYYKRFAKSISAYTGAKWLQAENQLLELMDIKIASGLPLIKP
ncbi:MAG: hypothetical protein IT161_08625 [Bryobacterales bacterium]|nr:hypothetical protein [Bryobacterales bacterium]